MTSLLRHTAATPILALTLTLAMTLALAGCGSSDSTAPAPDDLPPGDDDPVDSGLPPIPTLADYGSLDAIPATSDTLLASIALWEGPFTPAIEDMHSEYSYYMDDPFDVLDLDPVHGGTFEGWHQNRPPVVTFHWEVFDVTFNLISDPFQDGPLRFVLASDGERRDQPTPLGAIETVNDGDGTYSHRWFVDARVFQGDPGETMPMEIRIPSDYVPVITQAPHLKRELYWQLSNISGESYRIIQPGYTFTESTTYTTGVSETESYEFFWSLTTEVGGSYGAVSASVSASIGETFGTSMTVTEEHSVTRTEEFTAPGDQAIMVTRWHLMERFTFCDEDGGPLSQGGLRWTETPLIVPGENRVFIEPYGGQ